MIGGSRPSGGGATIGQDEASALRWEDTSRQKLTADKLMADRYLKFERELSGPNEVFAPDGAVFSHYRPVLEEIERMGPEEWNRRVRRAHERMLEEQRALGISGEDKTHPTDYLPRVIPAADWETLERGLVQRMLAVNEWLRRLEDDKDEVVPKEIIESSALYDASIPNRFGEVPNRQMGFDIVAVEGEDGWKYLVIEDNAKMPVGIEPMTLMRARTAEGSTGILRGARCATTRRADGAIR